MDNPETQTISGEKGSIPMNIGSDSSKDPRRGQSENQAQINNQDDQKSPEVGASRCLSATPQELANKI